MTNHCTYASLSPLSPTHSGADSVSTQTGVMTMVSRYMYPGYSHMRLYPSRRATTPFSSGAVKESFCITQQDMSRDHLHRAQQRVEVAHVRLRPLEALGLLRVDHPHGIQRVVGALHQRQRAVEEHRQEHVLREHQADVGAARQQLLDAFLLRRLVVRVLLPLPLQRLQTLLGVRRGEDDHLAALAQLLVLLGVLLRERLGEEEDDRDEHDQTDHAGREAGDVVAVLRVAEANATHVAENRVALRDLGEVLLGSGEEAADAGTDGARVHAGIRGYLEMPPTVWKMLKPSVCV